jgi:HK97 family phage prohead protease
MKPIELKNTVLIGDYKEVDGIEAKTITKDDSDSRILKGLIISGYETKFTESKNTNNEVFERGCLTECIENYFIKNKLNIPCDILHNNDIEHAAGVVLVLEENSVGWYFTVYIPHTYHNYEKVLHLIKTGYLQGFSKYGWCTDYEYKYNPDGSFSHLHIKKMSIYRVSLVDIPANAVPFEKVKEVSNATKFVQEPPKQDTQEEKKSIKNMFNLKK